MIPMHMGIMTPSIMMPSMQVISKPPMHKKDIMRVKENNENSGPTTTVFVGNISEKASDMLIRQLLAVRNRFSHRNYESFAVAFSFHIFNPLLPGFLTLPFCTHVTEVWNCTELEESPGSLWQASR